MQDFSGQDEMRAKKGLKEGKYENIKKKKNRQKDTESTSEKKGREE